MKQMLLLLFVLLLPHPAAAQTDIVDYMKTHMLQPWNEDYMYFISVQKDRTAPGVAYRTEGYRICMDRALTSDAVLNEVHTIFNNEFGRADRADHYRTTQGDTTSYTLLYEWPASIAAPNRPRVLAVGNHAFTDHDYRGIAIIDSDEKGIAMYADHSVRCDTAGEMHELSFAPFDRLVDSLAATPNAKVDTVRYKGQKGYFMLLTGFKENTTTGERLTLACATPEQYQTLKRAMMQCINFSATSYYTEYAAMTYLTDGASSRGIAISYDADSQRLSAIQFKSAQAGSLCVPWSWPTCTRYDGRVTEGVETPPRLTGVKQLPVFRSVQ